LYSDECIKTIANCLAQGNVTTVEQIRGLLGVNRVLWNKLMKDKPDLNDLIESKLLKNKFNKLNKSMTALEKSKNANALVARIKLFSDEFRDILNNERKDDTEDKISVDDVAALLNSMKKHMPNESD
jgi:hypothetical protein